MHLCILYMYIYIVLADLKLRLMNPPKKKLRLNSLDVSNRYMELAQRVDDAIGFMVAAGLTADHPIMTTTEFWTSHECLHLPYEQALTREDSTSGQYYDCSAHMLWVGERTRQLDGAHVEFLRGVANPLGIKVIYIS